MTARVNTSRFEVGDPKGLEFFRARGFVVVSGVLADAELRAIDAAWDEVVDQGARANDMPAAEFVTRYPQNRDLWRKHPGFRSLLFESRQGDVAARFLGTSGVRLFHDHAIAKPVHASGIIPWHQDSAYWPLDRVGLSIWSPTTDVDVDGGCLEVVDQSHLDGPGMPQDFLVSNGSLFDRDPRITRLPVRRGESVILSGLTWHRSGPNTVAGRRLAYLTLWVPATARFRPEHAGWHPTASHVEVAPGERLDGEWFPRFGELATEDEGEPVAFPMPVRAAGPSMFTASKDIRGQIAWLLSDTADSGDGGGLSGMTLADRTLRARIAGACIERGYLGPEERDGLLQVLEDLHLNDEVRRRSVARDVYLHAPLRWWSLVGGRIAEEMARGRS